MQRRKAWFFLIIAVVLIILFFAARKGYAPTAPEENQIPDETPSAEQTAPAVFYTDSGFTPSVLTIKTGQSVTFVNDSSNDFWPASAVHPTHAGYPTTGGCLGSTFDACAALSPGSSWTFTFEIPGSWPYHDHLNARRFGTIVVEDIQQ